MPLLFIKKIFNAIDLSFITNKILKKNSDKAQTQTKSSKVYALERLKEIHNYDYTTFVAKHYSNKGDTVWEYSKERNLVNHPLNLIVKHGKDILLIECKSNIGETTLENILELERVGTEFVMQYILFQSYNILYLYVCSEDNFSDKAQSYIQDNKHISYKILKEFQE